jgi:uncharacterized protein
VSDRKPLFAGAAARLETLDWPAIEAELDERGWSVMPALLDAESCRRLAATYEDAKRFRSKVVMQRHGFGRGDYQYLAAPLPADLQRLRAALYRHLAPIASRWARSLGNGTAYPQAHSAFLERCARAGQTRPTPLLLRYGPGDFNRLHQDLYGELAFPFQFTFLLSEPGRDFTGGEFVLTEQRPRMQSRASVVPLARGSGVIFAVNHRPVAGQRGFSRAMFRHGVSEIRSGRRFAFGVILHDAR